MRNAAYFIAGQESTTGTGILHTALRAIEGIYRTWKNRRDVASLSEFDDRMLSDIGLTRGDVSEALDGPFARDPGRELQVRAARNIQRRWNV